MGYLWDITEYDMCLPQISRMLALQQSIYPLSGTERLFTAGCSFAQPTNRAFPTASTSTAFSCNPL